MRCARGEGFPPQLEIYEYVRCEIQRALGDLPDGRYEVSFEEDRWRSKSWMETGYQREVRDMSTELDERTWYVHERRGAQASPFFAWISLFRARLWFRGLRRNAN